MVSIDDFCNLLRKSRYFDELEVKVLQAMLVLRRNKQLKCNANTIASTSNLSVTNTYKYLYSLQKKGLVESSKDKNKIFWLSSSTNPFPRILSYIGKEYLIKKDLYEKLASKYSALVPEGEVWGGEKVRENYDEDYLHKSSFIIDVSKKDVMMTMNRFNNDYVFVDSLKRAVERGVKIRIIAEEIDSGLSERLRKIGIEMRLGKSWPYIIVSDSRHGVTNEFEGGGRWFLNIPTDYSEKFEEMWENAQKV